MTVIAWRLDADGIFVRNVALESAAEAGPLDVLAGSECDLPPGKYKWDGQTMVPLAVTARRPAPDTPSVEEVVFQILKILEKSGQPLPARVDAWQRWFRQTTDAKG